MKAKLTIISFIILLSTFAIVLSLFCYGSYTQSKIETCITKEFKRESTCKNNQYYDVCRMMKSYCISRYK